MVRRPSSPDHTGMDTNFPTPESAWDSENRQSPFSTVADIEDEWCDACGDAHNCEDCVEAGF